MIKKFTKADMQQAREAAHVAARPYAHDPGVMLDEDARVALAAQIMVDRLDRNDAMFPMPAEVFVSNYDYAGFTDEKRIDCRAYEVAIWSLYQRARRPMELIGKLLIEAKRSFLKHGQFEHWRAQAFPYIPDRSLRRYQSIALIQEAADEDHLVKTAKLADLKKEEAEKAKKAAKEGLAKSKKKARTRSRKQHRAAAKFLDYLVRYMPPKAYLGALAALNATSPKHIMSVHYDRKNAGFDYYKAQHDLRVGFPNGLSGDREHLANVRPLALDEEWWDGPYPFEGERVAFVNEYEEGEEPQQDDEIADTERWMSEFNANEGRWSMGAQSQADGAGDGTEDGRPRGSVDG